MSYMLSTRVFLDTYNGCYKNIIVINSQPAGPLGKIVRKIQMPPLSPFNFPGQGFSRNVYKDCAYALLSLSGIGNCTMGEDEIPDLFSFLISNGYKIDTSLTKMMNNSEIKINDNKILCFITYNG